ncbi:hypothetical protein [Leucobacter sp. cx-169]|uniref:hypothetical protein n=1 Tax=Leucobacter sp. cx-169 TaxID=2770549 RepID=UPI00165DC5F4|nr:hypothetical protein [Leucobacter sp. cx-169]MBC9927299.1 hypothetical protein [Leucobacter sp. cx-169]
MSEHYDTTSDTALAPSATIEQQKKAPEILIVWSGRGGSGKSTLAAEVASLARSRGMLVDVADLSFQGRYPPVPEEDVTAFIESVVLSTADLVIVDTATMERNVQSDLRRVYADLSEAGAWGVQIIDYIDLFNSGSEWFKDLSAAPFSLVPDADRQLAVLGGRGVTWLLEEVARIGQLEEFKQFDLIGAMPDRTPVRRRKLFRRVTRDVTDDQTTNSLILDRMGFQHRA